MDFVDVDDFISMFPDEIQTEKKLMELGMLKKTMVCETCEESMGVSERGNRLVFRCGKRACINREVSVRLGSIFYDSRLSCRDIMKIAKAWIQGEAREAAVNSTKVNKCTVTQWYLAFRELVSSSMRERTVKLGGPGIIVQIDETKLGKRKYHRGHRVEGVWVVCGLEVTTEGRAFCVQVERRDAITLEEVIRNNVAEGSEVWTDGWKAYNEVSEKCNVVHKVVNHSLWFKDPLTGVCTNGVEGLNSALKSSIIPQHRTEKFASVCLAEFIWKRENKGKLCEAFIRLLQNSLV
jgi:transposase-like protein